MNENELQQAYEAAGVRVESKAAELNAVTAELAGIITRLVDASEKQRPAIVARRGELVNLRGVLLDELGELKSRKRAAYVAIYQARADAAEVELQRLAEAATTARHAMQAADDVLLHLRNQEPNGEKFYAARVEQTRLQGESTLARRRAELAKAAAERARVELEEAKAAAE